MIIEGLATTLDPDGGMHVAAMGPAIDEGERDAGRITRLLLRPFATSTTAANLARHPEGVFHVTDDVRLVARIVAGARLPPTGRPAGGVRGWMLEDFCRAYEFRVEGADTSGERTRLEARVVREHEGRPFLGFNRAAHAVVEGAILVTRLHMLDPAEVSRRLDDLAVLVEKTGGGREREAFAVLREAVARAPRGRAADPV